jgi:hypothetical protein
MAVDVLMVGREAVTFAWTMHPDAFGYLIRRVTRDADGVQTDVLRAVVYEGMYCDPALSPDREYLYEISSIPDPEAAEQPDEPADRQRVRIRTRPELEYPSVRTFFSDFIAPTFRRRVDSRGARWCPEWFAHPEVLFAVTELWNAYEAMRPPELPLPPGKSRAEWLAVFAWPFLDRLTSQDGPLKDCYPTPEDGDGRCHIPLDEAKMRALPDTPALS